jgi:hypothetical protein
MVLAQKDASRSAASLGQETTLSPAVPHIGKTAPVHKTPSIESLLPRLTRLAPGGGLLKPRSMTQGVILHESGVDDLQYTVLLCSLGECLFSGRFDMAN